MKTITSKLSVLVLVCGVALSSFGCSSEQPDNQNSANTGSTNQGLSMVKGRVGDSGPSYMHYGFGGKGTLAATKSVKISAIDIDGSVEELTNVALDASGAFNANVKLGANVELLIATALDASGRAIGSASAAIDGASDAGILFAPITTETSLEARVMAQLLTDASADTTADLFAVLQTQAYVDSKLALAAGAALDAGANLQVLIDSIAQATLAASEAQLGAFANAGIKISADAMAMISAQLSAKLNAALDAGADGNSSAQQLEASLMTKLRATLNISADLYGQAQAAASAAFNATIAAALDGMASANAVVDAAIQSAAKVEAQVAAAALVEIVKLSGAAQATVDIFVDVTTRFMGEVQAASSMDAILAAKAHLRAQLEGNPSSAGALSALINGGLVSQTSLTATVDAVVALAAKLDANLQAALATYVNAVVNGAAQGEIDAAARAVIDAYADFHAEAQQITVVGASDVESQLVVKVCATAEAMFQNP